MHFRVAHYVSIRALSLLSGRLAKEQAVGVASKDLLTAWERKKEISTMVLRGEVMKRNLKLRVRLLVMMNTTMLLMLVYC